MDVNNGIESVFDKPERHQLTPKRREAVGGLPPPATFIFILWM